jgi:quinol monooxygenase YgiN
VQGFSSDQIMTLAVFRVAPEHRSAFRQAWQALCEAFLGLPQPPSTPMTLIQSNSDPGVFQSLGAWHSLEAVLAMRQDSSIVPLMNAMVALTESAQPGEFTVLNVIPAG